MSYVSKYRARHTFEYGYVPVPAKLRRALIDEYKTLKYIQRALKISKFNTEAIWEPYGVLAPEIMDRVLTRCAELGVVWEEEEAA